MSKLNPDHDASRRQFHRLLLATLAIQALPAHADGPDWQPIMPPQPGDDPHRIEVLEFFSWGCPHCRDFNPRVTKWAEKLPRDVVFRKIPVSFGRAAWSNLAQLYYTLEGMGQLKRLDEAVFTAIHEQHVDLYTKDGVSAWIRKQGIDAHRFAAAFDSFSTTTEMKRAEQLSQAYDVRSVPMITVAGRYKVIGESKAGQAGMLVSANQLIQRARKELHARR